MLAKYGRGSISLHSPEYECMTSFEFVTRKDLPQFLCASQFSLSFRAGFLFLFDIFAIATNDKPLLKQSSSYSYFLPVIGACKGGLPGQCPGTW